MKVILIQDVKNLGQRYALKDVSSGYARNFLFVHKLADPATPRALKENELRVKNHKFGKEKEKINIKKRLEELDNKTIEIKRRANEQGTLFDSLDARELGDLLKINPDWINLEHPIKHIGTHVVELLHDDIKTNTNIDIQNLVPES